MKDFLVDLVLDHWKALLAPEACDLLEDLSPGGTLAITDGSYDAATIDRLRQRCSPGVVAAAIDCALARRSANGRLRDSNRWISDRVGMMMASSSRAARYKAARFCDALKIGTNHAGVPPVRDLCCGIGADSVELAAAGLAVHSIDSDPVRAWMTSVNASRLAQPIETHALDVTTDEALSIAPGAPFHLDPERRSKRQRRSSHFADARPGPDFLERLLVSSPSGCVKLAPGQDDKALPPGEFEVISERGTLTQGLLWTGALATASNKLAGIADDHRIVRATLIEDSPLEAFSVKAGLARATIAGISTPATELPRTELDAYVHTVDPGPERVRLLPILAEQTGLGCWHPMLGLLTGPAAIPSPWLTAFRVCASIPWNRRRVTRWLREHDAGIVEVKTRDKLVEPSMLQKALRGKGNTTYTLFVLRYDRSELALITERETAHHSDHTSG